MSHARSSNAIRDLEFGFDFTGQGLAHYRPRVSGMCQSFDILDYPLYPTSNHTFSLEYPQASSSGDERMRAMLSTSVGMSSTDIAGYPLQSNFASHSDQSSSLSRDMPQATYRAENNHWSGYGASPQRNMPGTLEPPLLLPRPATRLTNQPRGSSINRGGSIRREAVADKICDDCGASFTRNERLRCKRISKNIVRFDHYEKESNMHKLMTGFSSFQMFLDHIQRVHLQMQPDHDCEVRGCNRAFRQRSDLVRHQRTVHRELFSSWMKIDRYQPTHAEISPQKQGNDWHLPSLDRLFFFLLLDTYTVIHQA